MAVSPATIKAMFLEFASASDVRIQLWIDAAELSVNRRVWGAKADLGVSFLTAHYLTTSPDPTTDTGGPGSTTGSVTEERVGELARKYGDTSTTPPASESNAALSSTRYGQEFIRLRKEVPTRPIVINQSGSMIP